jgi:hypothetical protein
LFALYSLDSFTPHFTIIMFWQINAVSTCYIIFKYFMTNRTIEDWIGWMSIVKVRKWKAMLCERSSLAKY